MLNNSTQKRELDVVIVSDIHLGTYGSQAEELLDYLNSIAPKIVVLNGDIIDIWQFKKRYWPKSHMRVLKHIMEWITDGVMVYYVTGNHDEMLRKFSGFNMNSFQIVNKVVLHIDGKKAWCFHGDIFDVTMQHSKWLVKLGAIGYDVLIVINNLVNKVSKVFGKGKISLSKKIKNSVKSAVKYINNFEETAAEIAIENEYDFVICGHIHHPTIRTYSNNKGKVDYLNSGDWVENLTALEYSSSEWKLYKYNANEFKEAEDGRDILLDNLDKSNKEIFNEILKDFNLMKSK